MGDLLIRQKLELVAAKAPSVAGAPLTDKDFDFTLTLDLTTLSEDSSGRFVIAASAVDVPLAMGTVAAGKMLVLIPEVVGLTVKIATGVGSPVAYALQPRPSVMHMDFTGVLVSNGTASPIKGRYFIAGD